MLTYNVGDEIIIVGPNVWGQYIRQGKRGIVKGYAFGGLCIKMNSDDKTVVYPLSSCKLYTSKR